MSKIEDLVDILENKLSKVLHKQQVLKQNNEKLSQKVKDQDNQLKNQELQLKSWEEKYSTLKMANSLLGSNDNKRETKLKINTLIREIDYCISQLSE